METPFITVIVALLNGSRTLERCLDSVAGQTYRGWELIVQDGGSTDGSVEILKANAGRIAFWASEPDRSLYDAFNKALRRARGEWIYFLGADDYLWNDRVLESIVPYLIKAYPPSRVVYGKVAYIGKHGEVLGFPGEPWNRRRFMQGMMIPHQGVMHHRSLFEVHGPFNDSIKFAGDFEMLLRELKTADPVFVPDVIVAGYRFGGGSSLPENSLKVLRALRTGQLKNGIRFPGALWIGSLLRVCVRLALWRVLGAERAKRVLDWGRALWGKDPFWTRI